MQLLSSSVQQTEIIAANISARMAGGEVIALYGDLGAGKTQFVRGLLMGLGGDPRTVSSPTFALLHIYDTGRLTVYHLDAYRVRSADDLESIGFSELLDQGGVVVVEWPERAGDLLPAKRLNVHIEPLDECSRTIEFAGNE